MNTFADTDTRSASDNSNNDDEHDSSGQSQSQSHYTTESEFFYQDDETDHEEEDDEEDQTIESRCLIAIGVPDDDDDSSEDHHGGTLEQQQRQQNQQQQTPPLPPTAASDEAVAQSIAREEHDIKMRLKEERGTTGRLRPLAPMRRTNANANANTDVSQSPMSRADRERQEKLRTLQARTGRAVPRSRPLREKHTKAKAAEPTVNSASLSLSPPIRSSPSSPDDGEGKPTIGNRKPSPPLQRPFSTSSDTVHEEAMIGSGQSSSGSVLSSQQSVSSGIDLDEKTRQRILSRSTPRRAQRRRPPVTSSSVGTTNKSATAANTTTTTTTTTSAPSSADGAATSIRRNRPSDDKRNLRISPRTWTQPQRQSQRQRPSPQLATPRASRPSDEKAAFRRRKHPRAASRPATETTTSSTNTNAPEEPPTDANNNLYGSVPEILGNSLREEVAFGGNDQGLALDLDLDNPRAASNNNEDRDQRDHPIDGHLDALVFDEDDGDDVDDDDDEPEIRPGAFAVSGIGNDDDEEVRGVSGYDSGFENDAGDTEDTTDFGEESEQHQPLNANGNPETGGTGSLMVDGSVDASVVTSTPLTAELYDAEAAITTVTAKILVEKEHQPGKIRKISVGAFLVMLIVAVTIVAVLIRPRNQGSVDAGTAIPTIQGWRQIGGNLTVENPSYDRIHFGNAVAISADGNRIAVGLPGSDNFSNDLSLRTGSVRIFDLVNDTEEWEMKQEIFGTYSYAALGTNVALSDDGKRVAIGAPSKESERAGYVSIYEESNVTGQWALTGNFSSGINASAGEIFGDTVGFSGDGTVIAIGDKYANARGLQDAGAVSIYREINGTWNQMGDNLFGSKKGNLFGWSVSLSKDGNRVAASSLGGNEDPGTVKIFDFNGTSWEGVGDSLIGNSTQEAFGVSVELSRDGSVLAVGATGYSRDTPDEAINVGIVRSYRYDGETKEWLPYGQALEGENEFDAFGSSISLSQEGHTIAIGGPENDYFCDDCGHVKIFQNKEEGWESTGSAVGWSGIDKGQFGYAVALSATGDRVVGGAPSTTFDGLFSDVGQVLVFDSVGKDESDS